MNAYVDLVLRDFEFTLEKYKIDEIPTVYFGGGTPSVLGPELLYRLVKGINDIWHGFKSCAGTPPKNPAEVTIEANPESCGRELLAAVREAGVNRISIGVQTFNKNSRQAIGRIGDNDRLTENIKIAAEFFQDNFSADLITGLPFQTEEILAADIKNVLALKPAHISLYALTIEQDTLLAKNIMRGRVSTPSKDESDRLWILGRDVLEKYGYHQYEVSNFCIHGKESLHNLRYWRMENWLGLGPAASGTIINGENGTGIRYTNDADLDKWLCRKAGTMPPGHEEKLDAKTLIEETFLMGFRLTEGPDGELFIRRFGKPIEEYIPRTIKKWRAGGLMRQERTALAKNGLLLLDKFLIEAFNELMV